MPADDSPAILVAKYLLSCGYKKTLSAFLEESGIHESQIPAHRPSIDDDNKPDLTIEGLLDQKRLYELSVKLERVLKVGDSDGGGAGIPGGEWVTPHPVKPRILAKRGNYVFVVIAELDLGVSGSEIGHDQSRMSRSNPKRPYIIACTVTGQLAIHEVPPRPASSALSTTKPLPPLRTYTKLHIAPILAVCTLKGKYLLSGSMHGTTSIHRAWDGKCVWSVRDHERFVVKIVVFGGGDVEDEDAEDVDQGGGQRGGGCWFATAGYDKTVNIYKIHKLRRTIKATSGNVELEGEEAEEGQDEEEECEVEKVGSIDYDTTPEALCFLPPPPSSSHTSQPQQPPTLIVSRRDSTKLYYYTLTTTPPTLLHTYELTPESSSHLIFTPMSISLSPPPPSFQPENQQPLLAISTDSVPIMKFLLVEAYTGRILVESFTGSPQTPYSNPVVTWRPPPPRSRVFSAAAVGSGGKGGVWVTADDGVIRGVEAGSGKVVAELKGGGDGEEGHMEGRKVRCLCSGEVGAGDGEGEREVLVSGGFDGKLVLWEV